MFKLRDFYHLPQLDPLVDQIVADGSGLIMVAGMEAHGRVADTPSLDFGMDGNEEPGFAEVREPARTRPQAPKAFLPSGLSTLFDIFIQTMLSADANAQAVIVAREKSLARVPRSLKRRIKLLPVDITQSYDRQVAYAIVSRPALLVIDRLTPESAPAAFEAARKGLKVITSMDTVQRGAGVARQVLALGVPPDDLALLRWIVTVQRLPTLCEKCKHEVRLRPMQLAHLHRRYPHLMEIAQALYLENGADGQPRLRPNVHLYEPVGCANCHNSGRSGDVTVFDIFHPDRAAMGSGSFDLDAYLACQSTMSVEEYLLHLIAEGSLPLDDLLWLETDMLNWSYEQLASSERALTEANATLQRNLFELEASNRVLLQRTEVLISLEDLGQALIASVSLNELASRVCRRAGDLCGADRVILYLMREDQGKGEWAEALAVRGWEGADVHSLVEVSRVFGGAGNRKVLRFIDLPPGVKVRPEYMEGEGPNQKILSGLLVPLLAQDRRVGSMIVQSTQKGFFTPGETALLQTFANQAALAIQRAGLVDDLRAKIDQLEAAQAELVKKERMERELELAREVQQSLLPSNFPKMPGFRLAVQNVAARQVGGDFYDLIALDEDHFGVVVADVSDKGLPAAMYMGLSRSLLLAEAHRQLSPRAVLLAVNRLLLELGDLDGFVSVFFGVVERSTRRMIYTRAGHERPWLLRDGQAIQLKGDGAVLGILDEESLNLSEEEIQLQNGDRLIMYSDGLTDVADAKGGFYGQRRFEELLLSLGTTIVDDLCQQVFKALAAFRGQAEQFDDMTLMILEIE